MTRKKTRPLRIELKLEPNETGLEELKNWPDTDFSPDFIVASSGLARFEFGGKAVSAGSGEWLPDYLGGLALNLARAAVSLWEGAPQASARFVDEPVKLKFTRYGDGDVIRVEIEMDDAKIQEIGLLESQFFDELRRTLDDFLEQLLQLNPSLRRQPDVKELETMLRRLR
jgi:hypothetical protein